jgi:5-methylcytosine-specific restriction protein A
MRHAAEHGVMPHEAPMTKELSTDAFIQLLASLLSTAQELGFVAVDVNAGNLHRYMGVYPNPGHRMPVCCGAMRKFMTDGDLVISEPPKGKGAILTIRYLLPRKVRNAA